MRENRLWRATYDTKRDSWVVQDAGEVDGEPALEYRFTCEKVEAYGHTVGRLTKIWREDGWEDGEESIQYGVYVNAAEFKRDLEQLEEEAREYAEAENLDLFLALIDIVKDRAYSIEDDEEVILPPEGLFEEGIEDAYTARDDSSGSRLHDHVERPDDECWRLHVTRIAAPDGEPLGWGVFAVLYPELTSAANQADIDSAQAAHILDLDHRVEQGDAIISADVTAQFMKSEREEDPDYAYANDSDILEMMSVQTADEDIVSPEWQILKSEALRDFLSGRTPIVREREHWHPHQKDMAREFAEETGVNPFMADQVHARLLRGRGNALLGEESPWTALDGDEDE